MNPYRNRLFFIIIVTLIGTGYVFWNPISKAFGIGSEKESSNVLPVKLGLDLQGGMRVVLEVDVVKMFEDLAKNKDPKFQQVIETVRQEARTSEEDAVAILQRKFTEHGMDIAFYFGSMQERDNSAIVANLQHEADRKSTRLNSSHVSESRMPSSA